MGSELFYYFVGFVTGMGLGMAIILRWHKKEGDNP
jgi:hypothetical protein